MARRIEVEIVGDSRSLERAFARSERSAKSFNQQMTRQGRATSAVFSSMNARFGAAAAGAGALALIKSSVDATREAEVVLGQTSIAVQDAGISWTRYAAQVDAAATRISNSSAFDDEAVLQSFQVFVRGQKDVGRSLQLSELAADVARGRYTDLATATNLVNKAAMGQIGALRRAGIAIDKNATSAEALDALLRAYGGSAQKYADSAAGSSDKLHVAWENLTEQAGGPLSSALAGVATELTAIVKLGQQAGAIKLPSLPGGGGGGTLGSLAGKVGGYLLMPGLAPVRITKAIIDKLRGGGGSAPPGVSGPLGLSRPGFSGFPNLGGAAAKKKAAAPAGVGTDQRNAWFDAAIGRQLTDVQDISTMKGQVARLQEISAQITARIKVTQDITRKLTLEDQVKEIARQTRGLQADIASTLAATAEESARKIAEAKQHQVELTFGWLGFSVERARTTATIQDDLRAYAALEAAIRARIQQEGRTLELEQELFSVQQQRRNAIADQAAEAQAKAEAAAAAAAEARRQAIEEQMGWLNFAVERAGATKTIKDDLAAYKDLERYLKARIRQEGQTLELVSELWRTRQKIADLNKSKTDPLAGLMQVSSSKLAAILGAGTGISRRGQARLGANIAGAEIQPIHVAVNIDGREVGRAVTTQQARDSKRTGYQTSGFRG